jgi:Na+-translocating ferredoxin:NAD+ oxidoreductase RNF subunit RnfB
MKQEDVRMFPNIITPNSPVIFDEKVCNGCNTCVQLCVMDILMPNPEKGKPPIILYPDECYYDGLCVKNCPLWQKGAIALNHPLNQRVRWKRKATGDIQRNCQSKCVSSQLCSIPTPDFVYCFVLIVTY